MIVGTLVVALSGFVGLEIMRTTMPPRSAAGLSSDDSASIIAQYRAQIARRGSGYVEPRWLEDVHLARIMAAESRALTGDTTAAGADVVATVLADADTGSYLVAMLREEGNAVTRWRSGLPVRVWVQPASTAPGFSYVLVPPARRGFTAWNEIGLDVSFVMVEDSTEGDVHVTWSATLDRPELIGTTYRTSGAGGLMSFAHVVLSTAHDIHAVQNAARHEAGHVLGLGHSPDVRDIMAAATEGRAWELTDADRRTARLLYRLPAGPLPDGRR